MLNKLFIFVRNHKKPAFWVLVLSFIAVAAIGVEQINEGEYSITKHDKNGDVPAESSLNYRQSLTVLELKQTEETVRAYFTEEAPYYEGVVSIEPMPDDFNLYQNTGV